MIEGIDRSVDFANKKTTLIVPFYCPGQDLNLHGLPRYHLKVVRLPISPPGRGCCGKYMRRDGSVESGGSAGADQLPLIQLLIDRAVVQKFIVLSLADDLAAFHDDDCVGRENRAETVGDHERRALVDQMLDGLVNQVLAFGIDLAGGFVKNQDRGLMKDGAGDAEPLFLSAGKLAAEAFQDHVVSVGFFQDEIMRERPAGSVFDARPDRLPLARIRGTWIGQRFAVGDIFRDCPGEDMAVLRDEADLLAKRSAGDTADIDAIDENPAGIGIDKIVRARRGGLSCRCRCGRQRRRTVPWGRSG